ncbi:hypothetical protein [Nocardia rhizosphaerihabitans]|uniref:Uncharacterized protein n=1 Tax=Nocardia rhizosphaerihabitans TaxID=1691570 RepID=A0ABQ2KR17_9NOCA|nr:hypothetical protein [Nocardia rhizosphaerihabitans]GGN88896.1 hypothetical protein GCM10011610_46830 [Nocardia rhizosphaerihabitans]
MGYPYGPQQGNDPYAGGYAQPGYGADPYAQQQGYPAQPYGAPAYGAQPYPAPGYEFGYGAPGYGQPRAGGGTAITAAVIALLLSLTSLGGLGLGLAFLLSTDATSARDEAGREEVAIALAIGSVPALLLLLGSVLLFRRKTAGRVLLILLTSISLIGIGLSAAAAIMENRAGTGYETTPATLVGAAIVGAIPLLILVMAAAPSTGRWIRAARQPAYPPYPY